MARPPRTRRMAEPRFDEALAALQAVLADPPPPLVGVGAPALLALRPRYAVWRLDGPEGPRVLRHLFGPRAAQGVRALAEAAARLVPSMGAGPLRVAPVLGAWADRGLILWPWVEGMRLSDALDADSAPALHARALDWLALCQRAGAEEGRLSPWFWLKALPPRVTRQGGLGAAVLSRLRAQAAWLVGTPVARAPGHGDFTSVNLILSPEALFGIDLSPGPPRPCARDAASYRAFQAVMHPALPQPAPDVSPVGRFFMGEFLLRHLSHWADHPRRGPAARDAARVWLSG